MMDPSALTATCEPTLAPTAFVPDPLSSCGSCPYAPHSGCGRGGVVGAVGERVCGLRVGERVVGLRVGERVDGLRVGERVCGMRVGERVCALA